MRLKCTAHRAMGKRAGMQADRPAGKQVVAGMEEDKEDRQAGRAAGMGDRAAGMGADTRVVVGTPVAAGTRAAVGTPVEGDTRAAVGTRVVAGTAHRGRKGHMGVGTPEGDTPVVEGTLAVSTDRMGHRVHKPFQI